MSPPESTIEEHEILDLLTALVDKSLVAYDESTGRYRLLETVRQYARDRMLDSGEGEQWRDRHLAHFAALAEAAEPLLTGAEQRQWFNLLETEHDNARAALEWSLASGGEWESGPRLAGLRLGGSIWKFWEVRGYLDEGRRWLAGLLAAEPEGSLSLLRAKVLNGAGALARDQADYPSARDLHRESLSIRTALGDQLGIAGSVGNLGLVAYEQGDHAGAWALFEECLALFRGLRDRHGIANALNNLGIVASDRCDHASARGYYEESLAIYRELGDRWGIANALNNLGIVAYDQHDNESARACYEESLALRREIGDRRGIASSLNNLGSVAHDLGDYAAAGACHMESMGIMREIGDRQGIAESLEGHASLAAASNNSGGAAKSWGAAERLREEIGAPLPASEIPRYERHVAAARAGFGDDAAFDSAWQEGRAMTLEQAIEDALTTPES